MAIKKQPAKQRQALHRRIRRRLLSKPVVVVLIALMMISAVSAVLPRRLGTGEDRVLSLNKPFTIAVLPDTQYYSESYPEVFNAQTQWIVDNKISRNIVFVTHLGDIVNIPGNDPQWRAASAAMSRLDKQVPYGIAPGNHDLEKNGSAPEFKRYFPMQRLSMTGVPQYLRLFETSNSTDFGYFDYKNSYHLLNAGGMQLVAFNLEFCPPDNVLDWTDKILTQYKDRTAIITTHSFINSRGDRELGAKCHSYNSAGYNGGSDIWQKLIIEKKHTNILLFLNGHDIWSKYGAARRTDYVSGKPVHQLMSDYQESPLGGSGYMRLMTFEPLQKRIVVKTYSPYLKRYISDPQNNFILNL